MHHPVTPEKQEALRERMESLGVTEGDLLEKFVRGSGAGGQKINKTNNCVFLKHLPSGVAIKCQMDRSRELNRFLARRELCDQLEAIREGRAVAKTQAAAPSRGPQPARLTGNDEANSTTTRSGSISRAGRSTPAARAARSRSAR